MKIPKLIHYCWFGGHAKDDRVLECMSSWRRTLPGYEVIEWNETNTDLDEPYLRAAVQNKLWSKVSNLVRLRALLQHGGVYVDTDIETIRPFDDLLNESCVLGFQQEENGTDWVNNAVILSVANHPFLRECVAITIDHHRRTGQFLRSPNVTTAILKEWGLVSYGNQHVRDVRLLETEAFYPVPWNERFSHERISPRTYCVHHWHYSWEVRRQNGNWRARLARLAQSVLPAGLRQTRAYLSFQNSMMLMNLRMRHRFRAESPDACALLLAWTKLRVIDGPFSGMRLIGHAAGSLLAPKLMGTYELELRPWMLGIAARGYETIIDIGCADGYYAVGLAVASARTHVHAFAPNPSAQQATCALATLNGVESRVTVGGACTYVDLEAIPSEDSLVLCDVGGSEIDLLNPRKAPSLSNRDLLVEIHDAHRDHLTRDLLAQRFGDTHDVHRVCYRGRTSADCTFADPSLSVASRQDLVDEYRTHRTEWLLITRKASRSI